MAQVLFDDFFQIFLPGKTKQADAVPNSIEGGGYRGVDEAVRDA